MERQIAIVGGGVSGLAVAEAVTRRSIAAGAPVRAVVLESESVAGGKVRSVRESGFVVETGPHGFLDKEPKAFELIERLGLEASLVRAHDESAARYIVRKGCLRKLPMRPPEAITSDVLPLFAKLRVALEPFQPPAPEGVDESVWSFAARRLGRVAADVLVDAMVTGIYGGDPMQLSLASAFPRMRELESKYGGLFRAQIAIAKEKRRALGSGARMGPVGAPVGALHSFREGLGTLTSALAERVDVHVESPVTRLAFREGRYRVEGPKGALEADAVVLAVPAYDAAALLAPIVPDEARIIAELPYAAVAVVAMAFRRSELTHPLQGFGFLAPHVEGRKILGAIWASSVFPEHVPEGGVMLRVIVGGARRSELVSESDERILAVVREELHALMGISPALEPWHQRVIRWPRGIPQYVIGHSARVEAADRVETRSPGLFLTGNAFRGVAMISCIADADRVAERVVAHVLRPGTSIG